jgi:hypothetical protein
MLTCLQRAKRAINHLTHAFPSLQFAIPQCRTMAVA